MADFLLAYEDADEITLATSAAVTGGQVVEVTGSGTVAPTTGVSAKVVGIAKRDMVSGGNVPVRRSGVADLTASGAIAAGDLVTSAANGQVATIGAGTFGQRIGLALTAAASGATVRVALQIS